MASFQGKRVLVLEDEYFLANDLDGALREAGASVIGPFNRTAGALSAILSQAPDAAILDINLAGDVSFAVADALALRHVPFVITSGYDPGAVPERHADVPFCQKPVTTGEVLGSLSRILSRHQADS